jgi:hypothetical protein
MANASDSLFACGDICACRRAVLRTYRALQGDTVPDSVALEAAVRVYRHHHPEVPVVQAVQTVECWVYDGLWN